MWGSVVGFLGSFMGQNKNGMLFVIGVVSAIGWALWYMESIAHEKTIINSAERIATAKASIATLEQTITEQKNTIQKMQQEKFDEYKKNTKIELEYAAARKELDARYQQIKSYEERWANVATKKPGLLANIINRATVRRVQSIQSATCRSDCDEGGNSQNGS